MRKIERTRHVEGMNSALAPYALATAIDMGTGRFIQTAGQIGYNSEGKLVEGGASAQAEQIMENLGMILEANGATYRDVARTAIYLADEAKDEFRAVNDVYARYFDKDALPARTTTFVAGLPFGVLVELDMNAFVYHPPAGGLET